MVTASELKAFPPWESSLSPAPGDLRIIQAFVNTLDIEKRADQLASGEGFSHWLSLWGLAAPGDTISESERRQGVDLREGIRELLLCDTGCEQDQDGVSRLERALGDLPLRCSLDAAGGFRLVSLGSGWPGAAAIMLTIIIRSMGEGTWARLKVCRRDECRWAFFDSSKNRSGRWCSMSGCGDIMKARAYRRRLQEQAAQPEARTG